MGRVERLPLAYVIPYYGGGKIAACDICHESRASRTIADIRMCQGCFGLVQEARGGTPEGISWARNISDQCDEKIRAYLAELLKRADEKNLAEAETKQQIAVAEALEESKANYARSVSELYEYKVVTMHNEKGGVVDAEGIEKVLSDYARSGWRLHTMYSNELGKQSAAVLGFGTNATVCEDVLIFERRVRPED